MTTPIMFWGDAIDQGSKPTFIFPLLASSLHVDLTTEDPLNLTPFLFLNGFVVGNVVIDGGSSGEAVISGDPTGASPARIQGQLIGDPIPTEQAIAGQLANLGVKYSQGGNALIPGIGTLAEISDGLYKYTLDSTETQQPGSNLIRIQPINALAVPNAWLTDIYLNYRVAKPGPPITKPIPGTTTIIDPQSMTQLQNYIQEAMNTILNAMQTKPTLRRDS